MEFFDHIKSQEIMHGIIRVGFLLAIFFVFHQGFAQTTALLNVPSKTTTRIPVAVGDSVYGVFHGRIPCQDIGTDLGIEVPANCEKLKWGFTFFYDPKTHRPTTYMLEGSLFRDVARVGKWSIVRGAEKYPDAVVFQLDPGKQGQPLYILKGDDNVLFILDRNKKARVGGDYLSYTFSRVVN
jgi:hypothetical protein